MELFRMVYGVVSETPELQWGIDPMCYFLMTSFSKLMCIEAVPKLVFFEEVWLVNEGCF